MAGIIAILVSYLQNLYAVFIAIGVLEIFE